MTLYEMIKEHGQEKKIEILCGNIDLIGKGLTDLNRRLKKLEGAKA